MVAFREHLMGAASGITSMVLVFFVPMVVVSGVLMAWQLYARRGESIGRITTPIGRPTVPPCAGLSERQAA